MRLRLRVRSLQRAVRKFEDNLAGPQGRTRLSAHRICVSAGSLPILTLELHNQDNQT
jgi:hypothetical protein